MFRKKKSQFLPSQMTSFISSSDSYSAYMLLGDQSPSRPAGQSQRLCISSLLSLAPFITGGGLLELQQGPRHAEAHGGLVGHAEGQAGRGVEAGVAEVEA